MQKALERHIEVLTRSRDHPPAAPVAAAPRGGLEGARFTVARALLDSLVLAGVVTATGFSDLAGLTFPALAVMLVARRGLYSSRSDLVALDGLAAVARATLLAAICAAALGAALEPGSRPAAALALPLPLAVAGLGASYLLLIALRHALRRRGRGLTPVLIVGAGEVGRRLEQRLTAMPALGLQPAGFVDPEPLDGDARSRGLPIFRRLGALRQAIEETGAGQVIFAFTTSSDSRLIPLLRECEQMGVRTTVVPRMFEVVNERLEVHHMGGIPVVEIRPTRRENVSFAFKHALDRTIASLALIVAAPVMIAAAVAVRLSSPGPILFRQVRVGRDGREFQMLKFRSMRGDVAGDAKASSGGREALGPSLDRRTRVGTFLRRSSLDELPQLLNVLKGDMSLVGPRPERAELVGRLAEEVDRYPERHRLGVGMTGWAQVSGLRGDTSLEDRIEWDNHYIENWSLWLDLKVLLMTAVAVLKPSEPRVSVRSSG